MRANNSRQNIRRKKERRIHERRIVSYNFGTVEWRQLVQEEYILWPKKDRRVVERRSLMRREGCRRIELRKDFTQLKSFEGLLTNEEKDMLAALMHPNLDD